MMLSKISASTNRLGSRSPPSRGRISVPHCRAVLISVITTLLLPTTSLAQDTLAEGHWRAWLKSPGGELPFGLEISMDNDRVTALLQNGEELIVVDQVRRENKKWVFDMGRYDSQLTARALDDGTRLEGEWTVRKRGDRIAKLYFYAIAGDTQRFRQDKGRHGGDAVRIAGRWSVNFSSEKIPAVAVFQAQDARTVTGTFLTVTGDYRFLEGEFVDGQLRLSCFDGAHAFLFHARSQQDGSLIGEFWSSDRWHETWTAVKDPTAQLPNAFTQTHYKEGTELAALRFPDLEGKMHALDDPEYAGKARLIAVFGSWCPNCNDATEYMVELDRRYGDQGLSILGLAFEHSKNADRNRHQLQRFVDYHQIEYPILIAGYSDKKSASKAMPILDEVRAYPTVIFVDGKGEVRAVHSGFVGPATGDEHAELRDEYERLIEEMLAEESADR